jgi:ATP-dependent exoDNAse (exonuclease V) alpha subunit
LTQTQTVREALHRRDLAERAVVIVDEAGQLDGRQLLDLIHLVRERNGRLLLCGDARQHGPVEASDALRAIERYSGLRAAELNQIRRQEPKQGSTAEERQRIRDYRDGVEAASTGRLSKSFDKPERLGAIAECGITDQNDRLSDDYIGIVAKNGYLPLWLVAVAPRGESLSQAQHHSGASEYPQAANVQRQGQSLATLSV